MKRQIETTKHTDDITMKKANIDSTKHFVTHFEDLSNEIIYEVFEYLETHHVYEAFTNLNQRFHHLLIYSTLPIKINTPLISKSNFLQYCQQIIEPNKQRIISLRLPNIFTVDLLFSSANHFEEFLRLETLIFDNIQLNSLGHLLLNHLSVEMTLHTLVVVIVDQVKAKNKLYRAIFRLPVLKYCKLTFTANPRYRSLSFTRNESSPIEHLVIESNSDLDEIGPVLSYVPQLRRLSWSKLTGLNNKQVNIQGISLKHLTHASFELNDTKFHCFQVLIMNLFHQLEVLRFSVSYDLAYLDDKQWELLISTYMPYLRIFDMRYEGNHNIEYNPKLKSENLNQLFISPFWLERQWHFNHQHYGDTSWRSLIFYSTNPYKRKHFTIYNKISKEECLYDEEINLNTVRHVHIHSGITVINCKNYFPNTTELTLSYRYLENIHDFNRILPLIQITQLHIDSADFSFDKMINVLKFIPNIHTLTVNSISSFESECITIENSEIFQLVSNTNMIKSFTTQSECRFEDMKLLIKLCPQLQNINMNLSWREFKLFYDLFLSKINSNHNCLHSICFENYSVSISEYMMNSIEPKDCIDKYSKKLIDEKWYFWW